MRGKSWIRKPEVYRLPFNSTLPGQLSTDPVQLGDYLDEEEASLVAKTTTPPVSLTKVIDLPRAKILEEPIPPLASQSLLQERNRARLPVRKVNRLSTSVPRKQVNMTKHSV